MGHKNMAIDNNNKSINVNTSRSRHGKFPSNPSNKK